MYQNPDILLYQNPIGIDAVIQSLQQSLYANVPWLEKSFGRAKEFREAGQSVPKIYVGSGEYYNCLPNDNLQAQAFWMAREPERWPDLYGGGVERDISLVVWANLQQINQSKDYLYTEELRWQVEKVIKANPYIKSFNNFYDDRIEDVFMGYVDVRGDKEMPQYLMYPYGGFRYDITVAYPEHADCLTYASSYTFPSGVDDMYLVVGQGSGPTAGVTTYQSDLIKNKKIRLVRDGITLHTANINNQFFWSFASATGTITVNPAWVSGEQIIIEVYGYA